MADDSKENEGVRILGAKEAQELSRSGQSTIEQDEVIATDNTSNVDLPHWSEAPTGEVSVIDAAGDTTDGWEALTGSQPRLRVDQNEWNEIDYDPSLSLNHDSLNVGSLGDDHISLEDSDENFEIDVAEKRAAASDDAPKITRISTVPDAATTEPIAGSSAVVPGQAPSKVRSSMKASLRARRPKRNDSKDENDGSTKEPVNEINVLITRTATAIGLGVVAIVCFLLGTIAMLILSAFVVAWMSIELCTAFRKIGAKPAVPLVAALSFFSVIAGYLVGDRAVALSAFTFFVFTSLWYLLSIAKGRPVIGLGISALVYIYVGVLGSFAGMILALEYQDKSVGVFVLASTVLCVAANDTAAYLFGKFMGKTQLAPSISPNKTMEGTTLGIIAAIIVGVVISLQDNIWGGVKGGIALGVLVAVAAIVGDLVESMFKRDCGLKDFGSLLPGHGGLMDRFDGLLFALPVVYYFALALH